MSNRKDGRPKITPDLSESGAWAGTEATPGHPMNIVNPPKVWVMSYSIRLNGASISDTIMVPRGGDRRKVGEAVGQQMAFALSKILQETFGE